MKVGGTKHKASPPLQKVGGTCPPVHPWIYAHVAEQLKYAFVQNKTRYDARMKASSLRLEILYGSSGPGRKGWAESGNWWHLDTTFVHRVNLVSYIIQKTSHSTPIICHIDRLRKFNGEPSSRWSKSATERLPSVSSELSEMTAENELPPVTSVQKIPTPNVPSRDSMSVCSDTRRPVCSNRDQAGLRRSHRHRRLPNRWRRFAVS